MSGSGWQTGTIQPTIPIRHPAIHWGRLLEMRACFGAVRGATLSTTPALRFGAGTILPASTTSLASGVRSRFLDSGILFPEFLVF